MNGVIFKYLVYRFFLNVKYSIWVDAKLQFVVDFLFLIYFFFIKENVDMVILRYFFFIYILEEVMVIIRWRKWLDVEGIKI